jgi:DNA-binding GntR family transcriptional regulator
MATISQANIQRTDPTPIYLQIEHYLERKLDSGQWPAHSKLPSEVDLAAQLKVSRTTLRRAIEALTAQGKLVRVHGRGTFVAAQILEQPLADSLVAFSEELNRTGIAFETRLIGQAVVVPSLRVAGLLGLGHGERVFALQRVRLVHGAPLAYLENYVALRHCPDIEQVDFSQKSLFETLEGRFKLSLDWGQRSFQSLAAEGKAPVLGIDERAPVLYLEQVVYVTTGDPIELSDVWLRGDRFRVSAMIKRYPGGLRPPGSLELY